MDGLSVNGATSVLTQVSEGLSISSQRHVWYAVLKNVMQGQYLPQTDLLW